VTLGTIAGLVALWIVLAFVLRVRQPMVWIVLTVGAVGLFGIVATYYADKK
jgi:hypothetical protein